MYKAIMFKKDQLQNHDFNQEVFLACTFSATQLRFASFDKCIFKSCNFTGCVFDLTRFSECTFIDSQLSYLDFSAAILSCCNFSGSLLNETTFQQFKNNNRTERKKLDLRGCTFEKTELQRSVFIMCNLTSVSFSGSNLDHGIFEESDLTRSDLSSCSLIGTQFETSKIDATKMNIDGFIQYGINKGFSLTDKKS